MKTPAWRSVTSVVLVATTWANLLYSQQGTTGTATGAAPGATGGTTSPSAPQQPAEAETPQRSALPETGFAPPKSEQGTPGDGTSGTAPGTAPGSPAAPKLSPFALPAPSSNEERLQKSPFSRPGAGASSLFGASLNPDGTQTTETTPGAPAANAGPKVLDSPATFSAPGFYGGGGVSLTSGRGRFAKPRKKWSVTVGMGFDDNTLQTPTNGGGTDDQVFRQVIPAVPEISQNVSRRVATGEFRVVNSSFIPIFRTETQKVVLQQARPEQVIVQEFPGLPDREREASVTSSLDLNYTAQWTKGRTAFTMDARAGVDYYWSRSKDPLEYEASLSLLYIRRISPRLQVSTALSASHQTQPDFTRLNAVNSADGGSGAYTIASSKTDLSYRWNRRFSTVTSISADIRSQAGGGSVGSGTGSFASYGIGQEFRYQASPRLTYSGEARYSRVSYLDADNTNDTVTLLVGADWDISRHTRVTARVGEAIRTFQPTGQQSASPFGEFSLNYQPSRKDTFTASSRYGFEESTPGAEQLVFRTSLGYQRLFTPKLIGTASINRISYETKSEAGSSGQEVLDGSIGLRYFYTRKMKFGANYSYTNSKTDGGFSDYYRNRIFFTGEYEF